MRPDTPQQYQQHHYITRALHLISASALRDANTPAKPGRNACRNLKDEKDPKLKGHHSGHERASAGKKMVTFLVKELPGVNVEVRVP